MVPLVAAAVHPPPSLLVGSRQPRPFTWASPPACRVPLRRGRGLAPAFPRICGLLVPRGREASVSATAVPLLSPRRRRGASGLGFVCFCSAGDDDSASGWPIFDRWDVPWRWQTVVLTMLACGLSFVLIGLSAASVLPYLGFQGGTLSLDERAELLFTGQLLVTAVVLGVVFGITNSFRPLPDDVFCYDLREPFRLQDGWLLWAGIGFSGAVAAIALTGATSAFFSGENPQRDTDALVQLLPLIGSSSTSTAVLVGITGVLAPLLEETVFRGFLMVSLTKCAAVFALAHLTPSEFPQLFVLGSVLGLSYAQTRNLLTPIAIHALWNSGVIILLTFLQVQGYDIRELVQGS
ncbi:unnamed protein product [Spirodela intermedia]|uniref:CAAX prenyl protease 2/Lysostaphin resistance protein A-like domain-containing protein n=1 Tax=Spirodela intermedia TaxID=51605 RepID=A0A7I8KX72_SPIIN|nr:unnamed protein product [Spirodela intermedia]